MVWDKQHILTLIYILIKCERHPPESEKDTQVVALASNQQRLVRTLEQGHHQHA